MNIKLWSKPDKMIKPIVQVALNRGIKPAEIGTYFKDSDEGINNAEVFGSELLHKGGQLLIKHISQEHNIFIVVDSDVDGFTSAAIMINYLYMLFPSFTQNHVSWGFHEGKQHGLNDWVDRLETSCYQLIICPDSATNDIEAIERLHSNFTDVLILDHHISDVPMSEFAVTINSQYGYPNKQLSGAGVVYQFCKYLDKIGGNEIADEFLDLVALGLTGDMMSMTSIETKKLIFKGFKSENVKNPFIYEMSQKQEFSLSKSDYKPSPYNHLEFSPYGAAFFIVPFVNAICRSGTIDEKELIFNSMLTMKAFEKVPSTKRGHKLGDMERIVDQALRTCTNVKNRQTRAQDAGMELLESLVENDNMINDKVFVFAMDPGQIDKNVAGLCANKMMAKYQRPVCVLTGYDEVDNFGDKTMKWAGSMRGYNKTGIVSFKDVAETSPACEWVRGHENAAGICITHIDRFISDMNEQLKDISTEMTYYVDYIWQADNINGDTVIELADMNDYIGTDFDRPLVYIENIPVSADNFLVMKSNTLRYKTPSGINIIQFGGTDEEIATFSSNPNSVIYINAVCKCCKNEWNWEINPQLQMVDYEIVDKKYDWGF